MELQEAKATISDGDIGTVVDEHHTHAACTCCERLFAVPYRLACDVEVYERVMKARGEEDPDGLDVHGKSPRHKAADQIYERRDYTNAEYKLRQDLGAMRVLWHDDFWKDLWIFQRQMHPVLSLCLSHPLHVVHKIERIYIYVLLTVLAMYLACAKSMASDCVDQGYKECGVTPAGWEYQQFHTVSMDDCCTMDALGFTGAYDISPHLLSLYLAVLTIALSQIFFGMAACGCVQTRTDSVRFLAERAGHFVLLSVGLACCGSCYLVIRFLNDGNQWGRFWLNFLEVKALSWGFAFVGLTALWYVLWLLQKQHRWDAFYIDTKDADAQEVMETLGIPFGGKPLLRSAVSRHSNHIRHHEEGDPMEECKDSDKGSLEVQTSGSGLAEEAKQGGANQNVHAQAEEHVNADSTAESDVTKPASVLTV